jgi:hypothetical protein
MKTRTVLLVGALLLSILTTKIQAQGTAFTYQGQLQDSGVPANGLYDLQFAIYNASVGGSEVAPILTNTATPVSNGLFAVTLDFGPGIFTGASEWLDISVRTNGTGTFAELTPRQELTPTPYAIFAAASSNLSGTLSATQLTGPVINSQLANDSITVTAGAGLSGGGVVALGGSTMLGNAGVLSVAGNADITVTNSGGAVTLADTATNTDTANTIIKRDSTGSFSADSITIDGNINLPAPSDLAGIIYAGPSTLIFADGHQNFFLGQNAGNLTMSGTQNIGIGIQALADNTTGDGNTAAGVHALDHNTTGTNNTAAGRDALEENTTGNQNSAIGYIALQGNTTGNQNSAIGYDAIEQNTTGNGNTAVGVYALYANISNNYNTALGVSAIILLTNGGGNTALGAGALQGLTTGNHNIALGYLAGEVVTIGSNNIEIGSVGVGNDNGVIRIGDPTVQTNDTCIAGIYTASISTVPVYVDANGHLGTPTSSRRFKDDIQRMAGASEVLYNLEPVTFRYKPNLDPAGTPQFGLVAEEVDKVDPDLVVRDNEHGIYTVRYEAVNAMLLNEFLKEHRKVEGQGTMIKAQQTQIQQLKANNESMKKQLDDLEKLVHELAASVADRSLAETR